MSIILINFFRELIFRQYLRPAWCKILSEQNNVQGNFLKNESHGNKMSEEQIKICPVCSSEFLNEPHCPECYRTFADEFKRALSALYGAPKHRGNMPNRIVLQVECEQRIAKLKLELASAVKKEDFERACTLRDAIRKLEEENGMV